MSSDNEFDNEELFDTIWSDDPEKLRQLLTGQSVPAVFGEDGLTPLSAGAAVSVAVCSVLFEHHANLNDFNTDGTTALFVALRNDKDEIANWLLQHGAEANLDQQPAPCPPLNWVCERGRPEQLRILLENGCGEDLELSFGQFDYLHMTPMHQAATRNRPEFIRWLHQSGSSVNLESDVERKTPLHRACEAGAVDAIETLLELGAKTSLRDLHGRAPADYLTPVNSARLSPTIRNTLGR